MNNCLRSSCHENYNAQYVTWQWNHHPVWKGAQCLTRISGETV